MCSVLFFLNGVGLAFGAPKPVASLNVTAYAGRWYQVYASATVKYTFQVGANCVTADYGPVAGRSDEITVANIVRPLGKKVMVTGYAVADPTQAGVYDVVLGAPGHGADPSKPKPFSSANYVVAGLGPLVDGKYDFAIVTDFAMQSLYILTRDADRFEQQHEADVLKTVEQMGFTSLLNKPLKTNQKGCTYGEDSSLQYLV